MMKKWKMTFVQESETNGFVVDAMAVNGGEFVQRKGYTPYYGTLAEQMEEKKQTLANFGWTLYDVESNNALTFWKEF